MTMRSTLQDPAGATNNDPHTKNDDEEHTTRPCWSGAQLHGQLCMNRTERVTNNDRSVILDSGSTIILFKSKDLVTEIRN